MIRLGAAIAVTTTMIVKQTFASASDEIIDLNLLSENAWFDYGHREAMDYDKVSKKAPKANSSKSPT